MKKTTTLLFILSAIAFWAGLSLADEGTWTYDNPPVKKIEKDYGVKLTPEWFEHLRLSSVRLMDGGSGSFISPDGLVITNHHVAAYCVQSLSDEKHDYMKTGFGVDQPAEEKVCPGGEAMVLTSTENVTARVLGAVKPEMNDTQAGEARKSEAAHIEKECKDATGLRCDVVDLYSGGEYWLYRYKRYDDVRLVFAPEEQAAFFGGDPDNFNYPRFNLDFALLRIYENGKPVKTGHYLRANENGFKEGDLIVLSGNPSTAGRLDTMSQLFTKRDVTYPVALKQLEARIAVLYSYARCGEEAARQAQLKILEVENSLKVYRGYIRGLSKKVLMDKKQAEEDALRGKVMADPKLAAKVGGAWNKIAKAQKIYATFAKRYMATRVRGSELYGIAAHIALLTEEVGKPNEKRLEEYRDSALESTYQELYNPAPVYPDLDEALLANALKILLDTLGKDDPIVKAALGNRAPEEVAGEAVKKTSLANVDFRKSLVNGGQKAVDASNDPMIRLARAVAPFYLDLRKKYDDEVKSVEDGAGARIANARFAMYGKDVPPDIDFTPAISYGRVLGYEVEGYTIPYKTTMYGMFDRSASFENKPPFDLPPLWAQRRDRFNLATPFNFVNTADTFPGNSGSPIVNAKGELVGLLFDGNYQSLEIQYVYDDKASRSVAVHFGSIAEALRNLYGRKDLLLEIAPKPSQ